MALSDQDRQEIKDILKESLNGLTNDQGTGKLDPVIGVINTARHIRSQLFVIITAILAVGGAIQAAQAIWTILSPYIKFP